MSAAKLKRLKKIKTLSKLLDNAIPIPGTKQKIGLDPIIGLFPAIGDYLTLIVSSYIVFEAASLGAKQETLVKMATNILVDSLAGSVPVAGDLFDVAWKANQKNIELLEKDVPQLKEGNSKESELTETNTEKVDWKPIILIFGAIVLVIAISSIVFLWILKLLLAFLFSS
ncbi:hypothetical protein Lepto7376_3614 [[Leptolyngbya] sp. PCC 7376]|uniref:DUF4112 domain-containing protein n=1 Tax=[Leptolyngbya] sp. PCC 7376 TaxID=111781 RepID=UPI00029F087B|nr:DUF4112 domain-containing protein [[Leptolyngbya] sp. PCC 7376]AFY39794.1 hypothetical protein Lepto7376_3614 [[Leptolyngbya] sp. PCC 7376]